MIRSSALALALFGAMEAQTPLQNTGKPIHIPFTCTAENLDAGALTCSEVEPCSIYLELSHLEAVGNSLFADGNLHGGTGTISSLLLRSDDGGSTWTEPQPRLPSTTLGQIQFIDFATGWIAGDTVLSLPRDPFLMMTSDGGKTWTKKLVFEEGSVGTIEQFRFSSRTDGMLMADVRHGMRYQVYETRDGGDTWTLVRKSADRIRLPEQRRDSVENLSWRLRAEAGAYQIEKREGGRWTRAASFAVAAGVCK